MGRARIRPKDPDRYFLPYQEAWIEDHSRLKVMEKARQIGISWATAYGAVERTAVREARYDQWVSSRDDLQARLFIEDCKRFGAMLQAGMKDLGLQVIDEDRKLAAYVIQFANGKRIHSMSSNPDAQAGKRGGRILDEFALHPDPRKLWAIAYPGITWGGSLEVVSTHRGSRNYFNELIREVREKGNPKKISLHRVTLEDALNQGFLWKLQEVLPEDDDRQDMDEQQYFDAIRAECPDEETFQQEYMCVPADDDRAFLEYDLIASCEYPEDADWEIRDPEEVRGRRLYGGLDIGRKHDLTVLWILEHEAGMYLTRKVIALDRMSKPEQEKVLWPWLAVLERCCIDYTGLGIGWGDDAQARFGTYRIETVTFSPKVKESLAYPVRGAFEDGKVRIPYDGKIRADLRSVTKETTSAGNIRFTAERTPDGHADRFWALALALHAASQPAGPVAYESVAQRRSAGMRGAY